VVAVNKCGGEKFRSGERFGKLVAAAARISNVAYTNSSQIGPLGLQHRDCRDRLLIRDGSRLWTRTAGAPFAQIRRANIALIAH
jgi:hypothetical protein